MSGAPDPKIKDTTVMEWGRFKGQQFIEIPAWYLLWLYDQDWLKPEKPAVWAYIHDNYDVLIKEKNGSNT